MVLLNRRDVVLPERMRRCGVVKDKEKMWCCQREEKAYLYLADAFRDNAFLWFLIN